MTICLPCVRRSAVQIFTVQLSCWAFGYFWSVHCECFNFNCSRYFQLLLIKTSADLKSQFSSYYCCCCDDVDSVLTSARPHRRYTTALSPKLPTPPSASPRRRRRRCCLLVSPACLHKKKIGLPVVLVIVLVAELVCAPARCG